MTPPSLLLNALRRNWLAWITLALALGGVGLWAGHVHRLSQDRQQAGLERESAALAMKLEERMRSYEQVLHGAAALFQAAPEISRTQWADYARSTRLRERFPGILGLGFAPYLGPDALAQFEAELDRGGSPHLSLRPPGRRPAYAPVAYLEPLEGRNLLAVGYDMYSDPDRREALDRARDTGEPAITGRIRLLQAAGEMRKPGLLHYLPVYRRGSNPQGKDERRAALIGWVYLPYFADDLLGGIRGAHEPHLRVFDGAQADPAALLFDSEAGVAQPRSSLARVSRSIAVGGRTWTLMLYPDRDGATGLPKPWLLILGLGAIASLLLFWMVTLASRTRERAEALARTITAELHERQRDLESANGLLDAVLADSPSPTWVKDEAGRFVLVNEAGAALLGSSAAAFVGRTAAELYGRDVAEKVALEDRAALDGEGVTSIEGEMFGVDGSAHWGIKRKRAIRLADGRRFVVVSVMDLTEQRRVQLQLESARALFDAVFDAVPVPIAVKDQDGRFLLSNPANQELVGLPAEKQVGLTDRDLYTGDQLLRILDEDARARDAERVVTFDTEFTGPNGVPHRVVKHKRGFRLPDGARGVVAVMHDVTALKRAEHALRETQERLRVLNEIAGAMARMLELDEVHAVAVKALAGTFQHTRVTLAALGSEDEACVVASAGCGDLPAFDARRPLELRSVPTLLAHLHAGDTFVDEDLQHGDAIQSFEQVFGGARACMHVPLRLGERLVGVLWMDLPVARAWSEHERRTLQEAAEYLVIALESARVEHARQDAEAELRRHRDNLQELVAERTCELREAMEAAETANRAKSEFLTKMSHELRTPMHAILSFARLGIEKLAQGRTEAHKLQQYFGRIDQSGERLLALLNDLLDLSKLESGRMEYQFGEHDAMGVVRNAMQEFSALATRANVQLDLQNEAGVNVRAWFDPTRLGQVLRNLLSNAIKFTPPGGRVRVTLRAGAAPADMQGRRAVLLGVSDTGVGIPAGELEAIFQKFVQSSRTRSRAGGTGLGLAICREIVQAHAGRIWVESEPGGGSTFMVALPVERDAPARESEPDNENVNIAAPSAEEV